MFKAKKLNKVMIIGPRGDMPLVSSTLHGLNMLHIDSFTENAGGMRIGDPMKGSQELSAMLLRVRRLITMLGVTEFHFPPANRSVEEIKRYLAKELPAAEKEMDALNSGTKMTPELYKEYTLLTRFLKDISALPAKDRSDGGKLEVIAGYSVTDISGMVRKISPACRIHTETRRSEGKARVFCLIYYPKNVEKLLSDMLELARFEELDIPAQSGPVDNWLKKLERDLASTNRKKAMENLMQGNGEMLLASAEYLSGELDKVELPLRCATTDNFFILEGWVRIRDTEKLKLVIESATKDRVTVQLLDPDEMDDENTPALLEHNSAVRQFHYLVGLHSSPNFNEIDPTAILALIFPVFFGIMIGDIGYGIVLMVLGYLLKKRPIFGIGGNAVGNIILIGGFASVLFGAFMFGDLFGIPFHPSDSVTINPIINDINWYDMTGFNYPLSSGIHKLEPGNVIMLLILSVVAGFVHMTLALVFGLGNSITQKDWKYAVSRVGWLLILVAVFVLAMNQAQHNEFGEWFTTSIMFNIQEHALMLKGIALPYVTIISGVAGLALVIGVEGPFAVIESMSMVTNLISYSRLAAVGVAKAGLAVTLNIIFINMIMPMGPGFLVLGIIGLAVSQFFIVILLGALSAGIQSLRLHYVEFFMKFYRGDGKAFSPFGPANRYCQSTGAVPS